MTLLLPGIALLVAVTIGVYLYLNYSESGDATYDAFATINSLFWILTGVFLILGGFELAGMIVVAIFVYVGLTKGEKTKNNLRARIAE